MDDRKGQKDHGNSLCPSPGMGFFGPFLLIGNTCFDLFVVERKCHYEVREKLTPV